MDEKRLNELRNDFEKPKMSEEQLNQMKAKIAQAKQENAEHVLKEHGLSKRMIKIVSIAAAVALVFIILPNTSGSVAYAMERIPVLGNLVSVVTFRDYSYKSETKNASIDSPQLIAKEDNSGNLQQSTKEINQEISTITDKTIADFKKNLKNKEGYEDVEVSSKVIASTKDYFTLKLICFRAQADGYEEDYYYTINLTTGEQIHLADLFQSKVDYITPISNNIKKQMKKQMSNEDGVIYWLDDPDMVGVGNFEAISADQKFYIDKSGNIVICFNQGDVAPMCMGAVSFTIPNKVVSDILK